MSKSYRNRIKRINKDISTYVDGGKQNPGPPYKIKRKRLPNDINSLSAPPGISESEEEDTELHTPPGKDIENILENWRKYVESEE